MTLRHVVAWKLAAEDAETRAGQARELVALLEGLVGVVPTIRTLSAGVNAALPDMNADVALVADFADLAGLEAYGAHPAHQEVVAYLRPLVSSRMSVDFEV